jgi:hypothetical protein
MSDNNPRKGRKVISFPHGQPVQKVSGNHTVFRPTISDVWRDRSSRGYRTRCEIRGTVACSVMVLCFLLTKFLPFTALQGDVFFVVSITILAVWLSCELWDAMKPQFRTLKKELAHD